MDGEHEYIKYHSHIHDKQPCQNLSHDLTWLFSCISLQPNGGVTLFYTLCLKTVKLIGTSTKYKMYYIMYSIKID